MDDPPIFIYALRLADTALINGHRLSEWCGHAPVLEEDLALANIALDLIGQARLLYAYAGELEGKGRDEDALAYLRDVSAYRNCLLVELPRGDFASTIARQFYLSAFMLPFWQALCSSKEPILAAIAAKAVKEVAYHLRHTSEWVIRLGDGTKESQARMQLAIDDLYPYTGEIFETDMVEKTLIEAGIAVDPQNLRGVWNATLDDVLGQANLVRPKPGWMQSGGRNGRHSEHLGFILAEMQHMQRSYPGAKW